jgi:hypothetical protein
MVARNLPGLVKRSGEVREGWDEKKQGWLTTGDAQVQKPNIPVT